MMFTENRYYKTIILILASDNTPIYRKFREIYQEYLDTDPDIKVLFVYGNSAKFRPEEYDLVYDVEENYYPGMITKTVYALEHIDSHFQYDHLIRTNLSTFWDFRTLKKRLDRLPKEKCVTGSMRSCVYNGQKSPDYVSGVNLILSRDMVQKIVQNRSEIVSWDLPEDWSLSKIFIDHGIQPKHTSPNPIHFMEKFINFDRDLVLREIQSARKLSHDHYRIKNKDRGIDIRIAETLLEEYYGKKVS